jgi:hypothetical protein
MGNQNAFCKLNDVNYPKWSLFDAVSWKLTPNWKWLHSYGGQAQLIEYKRAWIAYNKLRIRASASESVIPPDFLGCVIFNEVGGDPPFVKSNIVLPTRQYVYGTKDPKLTSQGAIKIQLQAAMDAINRADKNIDRDQQRALTTCLETDTYNIAIVARFLRKMILFDYPKINTAVLTEEQFAISGSRYNRGTARALKDFEGSLKHNPGQADRKYTEYGRAMLRHRAEVRSLLGM